MNISRGMSILSDNQADSYRIRVTRLYKIRAFAKRAMSVISDNITTLFAEGQTKTPFMRTVFAVSQREHIAFIRFLFFEVAFSAVAGVVTFAGTLEDFFEDGGLYDLLRGIAKA